MMYLLEKFIDLFAVAGAIHLGVETFRLPFRGASGVHCVTQHSTLLVQIPQWLHELSLNFPAIRSEARQKPLLQFRPRSTQSGRKAVNEPVEWKRMHYHLKLAYESDWLKYQ